MRYVSTKDQAEITLGEFLNALIASGLGPGASQRIRIQAECGCIWTFTIGIGNAADDSACVNRPPTTTEIN